MTFIEWLVPASQAICSMLLIWAFGKQNRGGQPGKHRGERAGLAGRVPTASPRSPADLAADLSPEDAAWLRRMGATWLPDPKPAPPGGSGAGSTLARTSQTNAAVVKAAPARRPRRVVVTDHRGVETVVWLNPAYYPEDFDG